MKNIGKILSLVGAVIIMGMNIVSYL